jgi:hypothetical protein
MHGALRKSGIVEICGTSGGCDRFESLSQHGLWSAVLPIRDIARGAAVTSSTLCSAGWLGMLAVFVLYQPAMHRLPRVAFRPKGQEVRSVSSEPQEETEHRFARRLVAVPYRPRELNFGSRVVLRDSSLRLRLEAVLPRVNGVVL